MPWRMGRSGLWPDGGQRWQRSMRHVKGHYNHEWNEVADGLAKRGCGGRRYVGPPPPMVRPVD